MTDEQMDAEKPAHKRRDTRLVLIGVVSVLLAWFALANLSDVQIRFWITSTRAPLVVVIGISGALGAAFSTLVLHRRRDPDAQARRAAKSGWPGRFKRRKADGGGGGDTGIDTGIGGDLGSLGKGL